MERYPGRAIVASLLFGSAGMAACSSALERMDPADRPDRRDLDDAGRDGAGAGEDDDAGPEPVDEPSCPHAEEPSTRTFSKIYDPSVGEGKAWYINDHTFVRDEKGVWHLFGITHAEPANPFDEKTFAHATAQSLKGPWSKQAPALVANPAYGETLLWAPYVLREGDTYYMFYCGGGSDRTQFQIQLATSKDLVTWTREAEPLFKDGYDARDPMVLRVGSEWVLYYTANSQASGGSHVVAYRTSTDLRNWGAKKIAFTDPTSGTFAGPTESPFVVARGSDYFLFIGPREGYANTAVFHSKDPFSFDPSRVVHRFPSHAAEVVEDVDGKMYASHSGWEQGGVHLTELEWLPTRCERVEGADWRAVVETAPRAGILRLTAGGRDVVSANFRLTGPYLGVEAFADSPAGAASSVDVSDDGKRIDLKGIAFPGRSVTADWSLCAGDDALDVGLAWHVPAGLASIREAAFGVSTPFLNVRDASSSNAAEGDFPGFGDWALLGGGSTSLVVAYAPDTASQEDNRWLSSTRGTAAFQTVFSPGGKTLPAGDHAGGQYRIAVSAKANDTTFATDVAASVVSTPPSCAP